MMPFQTFYNLPEDKRARIIDASILEFSRCGYMNSSMECIASGAGISKGSMYQYFLNKKELFVFIINHVVKMEIEATAEVICSYERTPFFELLEKTLVSRINHIRANPRAYKVYLNMKEGIPFDMQDEILHRINHSNLADYTRQLKNAADIGEVRKDISIELAAFIVHTLFNEFGRYMMDIINNTGNDEIITRVSQFIVIVKDGLKGETK